MAHAAASCDPVGLARPSSGSSGSAAASAASAAWVASAGVADCGTAACGSPPADDSFDALAVVEAAAADVDVDAAAAAPTRRSGSIEKQCQPRVRKANRAAERGVEPSPTNTIPSRVAPPAGAAPMSVQDLFGERRLAFGDGEAEEPALSRSRRQMLIRAMDSERLQAMEKRLLAAREGESRPPAPVPVASTTAHPARGMRPASANPRSRVWNGGPGQGAGRASLKNPYASVRPSSARPFSARGAATRPSTARPTTARPVAARTGATRQHARPLSARRQRPQSAKPASRG